MWFSMSWPTSMSPAITPGLRPFWIYTCPDGERYGRACGDRRRRRAGERLIMSRMAPLLHWRCQFRKNTARMMKNYHLCSGMLYVGRRKSHGKPQTEKCGKCPRGGRFHRAASGLQAEPGADGRSRLLFPIPSAQNLYSCDGNDTSCLRSQAPADRRGQAAGRLIPAGSGDCAVLRLRDPAGVYSRL